MPSAADGAVAAIMAVVSLSPGEPRWRAAVRTQLAVSLALWPILNLFGLPVTVVAPFVNLLLIPLFGLVIVPSALLGAGLLMVAPDIGTVTLGWLAQLIDALKGVADASYERAIDAHVKNIRRKLEPDARKPRYLQTVHGVGYRFADA